MESSLAEILGTYAGRIQEILEDPYVTDVRVDETGIIRAKQALGGEHGGEYRYYGMIAPQDLQTIAYALGSEHDHDFRESSTLKTRWPGGYRTIIVLPPAVASPILHIRKKIESVPTLEEIIASGSLSRTQAQVMRTLLKERRNIIIAGLPGTGKTHLQLALCEVYEEVPWIVVIVDPLREIEIVGKNILRVFPGPWYSEQQALDDVLLLDPGALAYGEVRLGASGVQLIHCWLTGLSGGFCTVHAATAEGVLPRFASFYRELGQQVVWSDLAQTIHAIACCRFLYDEQQQVVGRTVDLALVHPTSAQPTGPADFRLEYIA